MGKNEGFLFISTKLNTDYYSWGHLLLVKLHDLSVEAFIRSTDKYIQHLNTIYALIFNKLFSNYGILRGEREKNGKTD